MPATALRPRRRPARPDRRPGTPDPAPAGSGGDCRSTRRSARAGVGSRSVGGGTVGRSSQARRTWASTETGAGALTIVPPALWPDRATPAPASRSKRRPTGPERVGPERAWTGPTGDRQPVSPAGSALPGLRGGGRLARPQAPARSGRRERPQRGQRGVGQAVGAGVEAEPVERRHRHPQALDAGLLGRLPQRDRRERGVTVGNAEMAPVTCLRGDRHRPAGRLPGGRRAEASRPGVLGRAGSVPARTTKVHSPAPGPGPVHPARGAGRGPAGGSPGAVEVEVSRWGSVGVTTGGRATPAAGGTRRR